MKTTKQTIRFDINANDKTYGDFLLTRKGLSSLCKNAKNKPIVCKDDIDIDFNIVNTKIIGKITNAYIKNNGIEFDCVFYYNSNENNKFNISYKGYVNKNGMVFNPILIDLAVVEDYNNGTQGYIINCKTENNKNE